MIIPHVSMATRLSSIWWEHSSYYIWLYNWNQWIGKFCNISHNYCFLSTNQTVYIDKMMNATIQMNLYDTKEILFMKTRWKTQSLWYCTHHQKKIYVLNIQLSATYLQQFSCALFSKISRIPRLKSSRIHPLSRYSIVSVCENWWMNSYIGSGIVWAMLPCFAATRL
jgi:hypothetical protein